MIGLTDLYSVLTAVVPLYVTMFLAYASVKWWNIFSPSQCSGINRFVAIFAVPLLSFQFISKINPYEMNLRFIAADGVSKLAILFVLLLWANLSKRGSLDWAITLFSLSTLPNTLVMGIPLLKSMYGDDKESLMVQAVVLQCIVWYTLLLFLFEFREARASHLSGKDGTTTTTTVVVTKTGEFGCKEVHLFVPRCGCFSVCQGGGGGGGVGGADGGGGGEESGKTEDMSSTKSMDMALQIMKTVWSKLIRNPNSYASLLGITWALVSCRWNIKKPQIMDDSVTILSNAGLGMAMFSLGLFMAMQPRIIACGKRLAFYSMIARFMAGPAVMAIASLIVGLRGTILEVSIVQAALPQGIVPFVFANEYKLHPDVLSTAVIFGMIVSLPITVAYYVVLGL